METMQQYVVRKLKEPYINVRGVSLVASVNRTKIYRIINGGETSATTIQTLHDFFRKIGD
jgi:hypothetical protein